MRGKVEKHTHKYEEPCKEGCPSYTRYTKLGLVDRSEENAGYNKAVKAIRKWARKMIKDREQRIVDGYDGNHLYSEGRLSILEQMLKEIKYVR